MTSIKGWRFWYTLGRVFDSRETSWEDLPESGALFLVVYEDSETPAGYPFRRTYSGGDWYWRGGCCEYGVSGSTDRLDVWIEPPPFPPAVLKRGAWVDDAEMERVRNAGFEARSF